MLLFLSCQKQEKVHWTEFIHASTPLIIIPESGQDIGDIISQQYTMMIDDITPSAISLLQNLSGDDLPETEIHAIAMFPDYSDSWQPVWITSKTDGFIKILKSRHQRRFEQNNYYFEEFTIQKLFFSNRTIFIAEIDDWMLISESSFGIEQMIRSYRGLEPAVELDKPNTNSYIVQVSELDRWLKQLAKVSLRPHLTGNFTGADPLILKSVSPPDNSDWKLSGELSFKDVIPSDILRSISAEPKEIQLDRYIPSNATSFSILQLEPRMVPPNNIDPISETDQFFESSLSLWQQIAENIGQEFAFITFAESGAESSSEFLFLREILDASRVRAALNELVAEGLISRVRDSNTYQIQSAFLGKLFGSELNPVADFYLTIYRGAAALSLRRGLVESVGADATQRRVVYYDDDYMKIMESIQEPLSSISMVNVTSFSRYLQPWLQPQHYVNSLSAGTDQLVLTTTQLPGNKVSVNITSYRQETVEQPYREQWVFPLNSADLTSKPVLADITESGRNEVVFSTVSGSVYALATDGTVVLQMNTEEDTPIGAPVLFDWYGNNQLVILQAAGNKIYAWNNNGLMLPNFPIHLDENITTPLNILDVTRNGLAEIIVGTADRNVHILNTRGQPINGWPKSTNAVVNSKINVDELNEVRSIFASSDNAIHAWNVNGEPRSGYPQFLEAPVSGTAVRFGSVLLASGMDGNIYSIGTEPLFADSLISESRGDSLIVQTLSVSESPLNKSPVIQRDVLLRDDGEFFRENLIIAQSLNGSLFAYNAEGRLRYTKTMGQQSASSFEPMIIDLDRNQRSELVALAEFGRLYAWDILNGERHFELPTTGMSHVLVADLYNNGKNEIIAQTRDGLRCWTIFNITEDR